MANYVDSIFLDAQTKLLALKEAKFEHRHQMWGAAKAFLGDNPMALPELEAIRNSYQRPTELLFTKKRTAQNGTARSCSPTAVNGDSGKNTVAWATAVETFSIDMMLAQNNQYNAADQLAMNWLDAEIAIWDAINSACSTYLNTNRTTVNAGSSPFVWDAVNFDSDVSFAQKERFYNYAYTEMLRNKYSGNFNSISSTGWLSDATYINAQNSGNATNLGFQFNGIQGVWDINQSLDLTPEATFADVVYTIPKGALAMPTWVNPAYKTPVMAAGDRKFFTRESVFFPGIFLQVMEVEACADTSATGGAVQSIVKTYEISVDYSVNHVPLSAAGETPIFKHNIAAS